MNKDEPSRSFYDQMKTCMICDGSLELVEHLKWCENCGALYNQFENGEFGLHWPKKMNSKDYRKKIHINVEKMNANLT